MSTNHDLFPDPTFNLKGENHSFDDQPSRVTNEYRAWRSNGLLHRDNGKPALESFQDGEADSQHWYIQGVQHNSNGPCSIGGPNGETKNWALFGKALSEKFFNQIISHVETNSCPLVLSWLLAYGVVNETQFSACQEKSGSWLSMPTSWLIHVFQIDNETLIHAFRTMYDFEENGWFAVLQEILPNKEHLNNLVKVASYLEGKNQE